MDEVDQLTQRQLCLRYGRVTRQTGDFRETRERLPRPRTHHLLLFPPTQATEYARIRYPEQVPRTGCQPLEKSAEGHGGRLEEVHRDRHHGEVTVRVLNHPAEGRTRGVRLHRSVSLTFAAYPRFLVTVLTLLRDSYHAIHADTGLRRHRGNGSPHPRYARLYQEGGGGHPVEQQDLHQALEIC